MSAQLPPSSLLRKVELKPQQWPQQQLVQSYALFAVLPTKPMLQVPLATVEYYTTNVAEHLLDLSTRHFADELHNSSLA